MRTVDPDQPIFDVTTLDDRIGRSLTSRRVPLQLIGLFAGIALVLAAIGIYGVLAFAVAQRTGEFGVRMAIGADAARIRREVLAGGAWLAAIGLGVGVVCALALGVALRSQLFGIGIVDPPSHGRGRHRARGDRARRMLAARTPRVAHGARRSAALRITEGPTR